MPLLLILWSQVTAPPGGRRPEDNYWFYLFNPSNSPRNQFQTGSWRNRCRDGKGLFCWSARGKSKLGDPVPNMVSRIFLIVMKITILFSENSKTNRQTKKITSGWLHQSVTSDPGRRTSASTHEAVVLSRRWRNRWSAFSGAGRSSRTSGSCSAGREGWSRSTGGWQRRRGEES